jgi:hypothetical protein
MGPTGESSAQTLFQRVLEGVRVLAWEDGVTAEETMLTAYPSTPSTPRRGFGTRGTRLRAHTGGP